MGRPITHDTSINRPPRRGQQLRALALGAVIAVAFTACAGESDQDSSSADATEQTEAPADIGDDVADRRGSATHAPDNTAPAAEAGVGDLGSADIAGSDLTTLGRDIAIEMQVVMTSEDLRRTVQGIMQSASAHGGAVFASDIDYGVADGSGADGSGTDEAPRTGRATLTVKVPPAELGAVLIGLDQLGTVLSTNQQAQDVTDQLVDLAVRIRNAEQSVDRVRDFLEATTDLRQMVDLEGELTRRQTDLEQLLATQANLSDRVSLSTLTIDVYPGDGGARPGGREQRRHRRRVQIGMGRLPRSDVRGRVRARRPRPVPGAGRARAGDRLVRGETALAPAAARVRQRNRRRPASATTRISLAPTIRCDDEVGRAAIGERERRPHVRVGDHRRQHDRPEAGRVGCPSVPSVRADLDQFEPVPAGDVDRAVRDPALRVAVVDRYGLARRVPLDVERDRGRDPVCASERIGRIIECRGVRLVADRPLLHRRVADVLGPEGVRLDEQRIGADRNIPFGDVQQRFAVGREARPVPRVPAEQPMTGQQPDRRIGASTPRTTIPRRRRPRAVRRQTA